jgi:hypothetical protein
MMRRRADWASCVIESASSRMMILYGGQGYLESGCETATRAKFLIFSRTIEMPRSSDALSSSTRDLKMVGLAVASQRFRDRRRKRRPTQRVAWPAPGWSRSCPSPVAHRTAYAGASQRASVQMSSHKAYGHWRSAASCAGPESCAPAPRRPRSSWAGTSRPRARWSGPPRATWARRGSGAGAAAAGTASRSSRRPRLRLCSTMLVARPSQAHSGSPPSGLPS